MLFNFSESGHPVFRGASALEQGTLHFCGDPQTVEVFLRTIVSVNQPSIYGAVEDLCERMASRTSDSPVSTVKPVAEVKPETMVSPTDLFNHD